MARFTLKPAALVLALGTMGLTACDGVVVGVSGGYYHDPFYDGMIWHDYYHDNDVDIDIDVDRPVRPDRPDRPDRPNRPDRPKPPVAKPRPPVAKPPIARPPIHRPATRPSPRRR